MKVTKPKKNQLLFEDDTLKCFDLEVQTKTGLKESEYDDLYESFILFYRFKGMDSSKQFYMGNKVSILTSITSILERLLNYRVITINDLHDMMDLLENVIIITNNDIKN